MSDVKDGISKSFARLLQKREVERWRYIAGKQTSATLRLIALELQLKWTQFKTRLSSEFNEQATAADTEEKHLSRLFNSYAVKSWPDIASRLNKTRTSINAWQIDNAAGKLDKATDALKALAKQARREAEEIADKTESPPSFASIYDVILDLQTPGLTTDIFEDLSDKVISFHKRNASKFSPVKIQPANMQTKISNVWSMPLDKQRQLFDLILKRLGFDYKRGQTGETDHPATLGAHDDVRVGIKYNQENFLETVLTAFHEGGHALYRQGLPSKHQDKLSGQIAGVAIDEAMALLMENHVARSREGAAWIYQMVCEVDPTKKDLISADDIYMKSIERSDQPIRTSADELRYPLDVILRYRIERDMFNTDFDFENLRERWKQEYFELTAQSIQDDRHGALQDIHWFADEFGWFPNYMLGQLAAAQIFEAALSHSPKITTDIARGDISALTDWLHKHIYSQGALFNAFELIENATGKPLDTKSWETHIKQSFSPQPPRLSAPINKF